VKEQRPQYWIWMGDAAYVDHPFAMIV